MTPSSTINPAVAMPSPPSPGESTPTANAAPSWAPGQAAAPAQAEAPGTAEPPQAPIPTAELIEKLQADRLWLLRQIDGGAWPEWRLDLAALERELGELLERVTTLQDGAG